MQTIYRVKEKYFCNLQRAMDYVENLAKHDASYIMKMLEECDNIHEKEKVNTASHIKGAWRKSQNGLSYVVKWEQHYRKHSASVKLIFVNMERRAEWKDFE